MKLQYLSVIFILIILPIVIVLSVYINTQISMINTEAIYHERLLNCTYDAIKAFEINTINTSYYVPESRVKNIDASVNTFFNSLVSAFKYDGNRKDVMKEYVPAIVFSLYDGYYVYSPFKNTLTNITQEVDENYEDTKVLNGLKPNVYYSCRYKIDNNNDFIINYTMDNFISIEGIVDGEYWSAKDKDSNGNFTHAGYLIKGDERT